MSEYKIRPITQQDNVAIASIIRQSLKEHNAHKAGTVFFDPTTDDLYSLFNKENAKYRILEIDGIVTGGAGVYPTIGLPAGYCELVKLYIQKEFRGLGYGKLLIDTCFEIAKELGYSSIYLETMPELGSAVALYEKCGFNSSGRPLGNSGHFGCDIWMTKNLHTY